jgi:hypothetical protein
VNSEKIDMLLARVDATRRGVIKGMIAGTAFVVPLVASFSMNGLVPNQALALSHASNSSGRPA